MPGLGQAPEGWGSSLGAQRGPCPPGHPSPCPGGCGIAVSPTEPEGKHSPGGAAGNAASKTPRGRFALETPQNFPHISNVMFGIKSITSFRWWM